MPESGGDRRRRDRAQRGILTREAQSPRQNDQRERGCPPDARGSRFLAFTGSSHDAEARTVEAVFSVGARVRRWFGFEELAIDPGAIDLTRVERNICPLLNAHNQWDIGATLGTIVSARVENGQLVGTIRFADTDQGRAAEGMVSRGELTGLSIGYLVRNWQLAELLENEDEVWRATSWELVEVSLVPVPADPNAGVRSLSGTEPGAPAAQGDNQEDEDMLRRNLGGGNAAATSTAAIAAATTAPPADGVRSDTTATPAPSPAPTATDDGQRQQQTEQPLDAAAVRTLAQNAGLDADAVLEVVSRHADERFTRTAALAEIGRRYAERDTNVRTVSRVPAAASSGVTMLRAMEDAIVHRLTPGSQISDDARQFRGLSLIEMAREVLSSGGVSTRGLAPTQVAIRALHTTSDFPALMSSALNRRLRQSYQENQPTYRRWARRAPNAPNFKSIEVVQFSAMPDLLKTNEAGEFQYGTASDGKVSYGIVTYGRIISLSRQLIINDDLRALDRAATGFAGAAARLENRTVYAQLTANPTMAYDSVALFHATHGNLAGSGGAIANGTLAAGRKAMRLQKGLQSEELNLAPRYLLAPASIEQAAYQYTSSQFVPNTAGGVNEFRQGGRTELEPIIDSVLDASSATAWYLAGDPNQIDTVEYCYLEGHEGVQIEEQMGFDVDGVKIKAVLDFAAATIDHRGLYKDPGS